MARSDIKINVKFYFKKEDVGVFCCLLCKETIIKEAFKAISMIEIGNDIVFKNYDDMEICEECYNDIKHKFEDVN